MGLEHIFPGLPPTPGGLIEGAGDFFDGVASFFSSSGPSAESIKVGMLVKTIKGGPGAGGLYEALRATEQQAEIQTDLSGQAHELVGRLEAAWSGKSSDGARQLIRSFADVADESSEVLASNARNLQRQVDGFERMRDSLEPMQDPPPEKSFGNPDFHGTAKKRIRRYQQQAERNRQRYQAYVDDTNENLNDLGHDHRPLPGMNDSGGRGPSPWPGPGPSPRPTPYPGPNPFPGPRPYPGGGSGGSGGGWGGSGSPYTPDFTPSRYDGSTAAASFGPGAGGGAGGFGPGSGGGVPGGGAGGGVPAAGGLPAAGLAGGATGAGGQSGVARPGGGAGAGAGARGAGGFGPRGGGMAGGAPMGGGGRGQGGEDQEYQRKSWLQENDPEGIFGTDELTPPPVIGDDEYE